MRDGKDKMNKKKKKQNGPMEATSGHPYMAMTSHKMVDMGKEAQQQMGETSVKTPLLPSPRKGSGNQSSGDSMLPSAKQQGGVRKEGITVVLSGCSREVEYHSRNVNQGGPSKHGPEGAKAKSKADKKGRHGQGQAIDRKQASHDKYLTQGKTSNQKSFKGTLANKDDDSILRLLASHRIFELRKRNLSFPNARFFCRLCEYHLDTIEDCEKHLGENRHERKKEAADSEGILQHIPEPTTDQLQALNAMLEAVVLEHGLSSVELQMRQDAVDRLQKFISQFKEGVVLQLYGSSRSSFGLKESDVNIEVCGKGPAPKLLLDVFSILHKEQGKEFINVQSDFLAKVPVVNLTDAATGLKIVLGIKSHSAVLTSDLLHLYSLADPRARKIAVILRCWAKLCHLDRQEEGTLPPFGFGIMAVYFLQQIKPPVLCVLTDPKEAPSNPSSEPVTVFDEFKEQVGAWASSNKMSIGELWVRLLRFYCLEFNSIQHVVSIRQQEPLQRSEKKWHSKRLAIEDPFAPKKNVANSMGNTLIYEYFQGSLRKAYYYYGLPRNASGESLVSIDSLKELAHQRTVQLLKEHQEEKDKDSCNKDAASISMKIDAEKTKSKNTSHKEKKKAKVHSESDDATQAPSINADNAKISKTCEAGGNCETDVNLVNSRLPLDDNEHLKLVNGKYSTGAITTIKKQAENSPESQIISIINGQEGTNDKSDLCSCKNIGGNVTREEKAGDAIDGEQADVMKADHSCREEEARGAAKIDSTGERKVEDTFIVGAAETRGSYTKDPSTETDAADCSDIKLFVQDGIVNAFQTQKLLLDNEQIEDTGKTLGLEDSSFPHDQIQGSPVQTPGCAGELPNIASRDKGSNCQSEIITDRAVKRSSVNSHILEKGVESKESENSHASIKEAAAGLAAGDTESVEEALKDLSLNDDSTVDHQSRNDVTKLIASQSHQTHQAIENTIRVADQYYNQVVDADDEKLQNFAREYAELIVVKARHSLQQTLTCDEQKRSSQPDEGRLVVTSSEQMLGDRVDESLSHSHEYHQDAKGETIAKSMQISSAVEVFHCVYKFSEDVFTDGKGPAVICSYCEQEGHLKMNCPEDQLPPVEPLPPMTNRHMTLLNKVVSQIIYDFGLSEGDFYKRNNLAMELEAFVRQIYPDAHFYLFGSSCNGFGFQTSDLDICMTLEGKTVEDLDVAETIENVAKRLKQYRGLYNIIPIPTAKVPIVKFTDSRTRLEGDISLYNILAQRNTELLHHYSLIDTRVRQLGYAVKVFAKVCDIGDASRGSLSSYGYILMMLHFLQQCNPPVIPVLQELYPPGQSPEVLVEGCNTWFFGDLASLPKVWKFFQKNKQTPGELWIGFFRYYLEEFSWKERVVTIRQKAPLTKFEKLWNGKCLAVEDPFDLSHNLGGGLSRKMNNYIYKTFVNGRALFGTPHEMNMPLFSRYRSPPDYFFDSDLLCDGKPPNDRGCRMCGKIGHMVKDCPNRRPRKQNKGQDENRGNNDKQKVTSQELHNKDQNQTKQSKQMASSKVPASPAEGKKTPKKDKQEVTSNKTSTVSTTPAITATSVISSSSNEGPPPLPAQSQQACSSPQATSTSVHTPSPTSSSQGSIPQALRRIPSGSHPPGIPVELQQLFNMCGGSESSLSQIFTASVPIPGVNPLSPLLLNLTPEQQMNLQTSGTVWGGSPSNGGDLRSRDKESPSQGQEHRPTTPGAPAGKVQEEDCVKSLKPMHHPSLFVRPTAQQSQTQQQQQQHLAQQFQQLAAQQQQHLAKQIHHQLPVQQQNSSLSQQQHLRSQLAQQQHLAPQQQQSHAATQRPPQQMHLTPAQQLYPLLLAQHLQLQQGQQHLPPAATLQPHAQQHQSDKESQSIQDHKQQQAACLEFCFQQPVRPPPFIFSMPPGLASPASTPSPASAPVSGVKPAYVAMPGVLPRGMPCRPPLFMPPVMRRSSQLSHWQQGAPLQSQQNQPDRSQSSPNTSNSHPGSS
ncbi:terminal uridylyltransferase 7-like isoform X2 [Pomacea canaliculata]|nr:terminal uridylyltransferase 7-like isoform X2 [Pomacea canaliculata]